MQCTVTGTPIPTIHWTFKNKEIAATDSHYEFEDLRSVLTVLDITNIDTGKYRCYAKNKYGMHFGEINIVIRGIYITSYLLLFIFFLVVSKLNG